MASIIYDPMGTNVCRYKYNTSSIILLLKNKTEPRTMLSGEDGEQPRDAVKQVPLSEIFRQSGISESVIDRINIADIDKDGNLDVREIMRLVQEGHTAQADGKLFRNLVVALVIGMLVLIAALCGTVYGIVKLTQEVEDKDGVLVSSTTGEVLTTGQVTVTLNVTKLYDGGRSSAQQLEALVVPSLDGKGFTFHRVASVSVVPGQTASITTLDGRKIVIDKDNGVYYEDGLAGNATATGRRLLGDIQNNGIQGIGMETNVQYAAVCESPCNDAFPVVLFGDWYRNDCKEHCSLSAPKNQEDILNHWHDWNYGECFTECKRYNSWYYWLEGERAACINECLYRYYF